VEARRGISVQARSDRMIVRHDDRGGRRSRGNHQHHVHADEGRRPGARVDRVVLAIELDLQIGARRVGTSLACRGGSESGPRDQHPTQPSLEGILRRQKEPKGKRHTQAVLAIARRRVNVLWATLRDFRPHQEVPALTRSPA
jgi:hypothetical protein